MFGKKARKIKELEAELLAAKDELTKTQSENEQLAARVASFVERERSISRALTEAAERADKVVEEANGQADEILRRSNENADEAKRNAEQVVDKAYQDARDIVKEAENESQRKLDETQAQIESYAEVLKSYDALVQENIKNAIEGAKRYVELATKLHATVPQILSADGKLIDPPADAVEADDAPRAEAPASDEKLWTVSELSEDKPDEPSQVDAIIDGILDAASEKY